MEIESKDLKARGWCFTIHDYTELHRQRLFNLQKNGKDIYLVMGYEICPETKREHIQGYIHFKNATKGYPKIKKIEEKAHIEVARGTPEQNKKYCTKDGKFDEIGNFPAQGKRNDILKSIDLIQENPSMRQIVPQLSNFNSIRACEKILDLYEPMRDFKPTVFYFFGSTGTGKTRACEYIVKDNPNVYWSEPTYQWWPAYDAHTTVIIDDIRADFSKFHILLLLLDRYPFRVAYKGGHRQFLAKNIFMTSCKPPQELYKDRCNEDVNQLIRRIDIIARFNEDSTVTIMKDGRESVKNKVSYGEEPITIDTEDFVNHCRIIFNIGSDKPGPSGPVPPPISLKAIEEAEEEKALYCNEILKEF